MKFSVPKTPFQVNPNPLPGKGLEDPARLAPGGAACRRKREIPPRRLPGEIVKRTVSPPIPTWIATLYDPGDGNRYRKREPASPGLYLESIAWFVVSGNPY